jgi:hypothetical protein
MGKIVEDPKKVLREHTPRYPFKDISQAPAWFDDVRPAVRPNEKPAPTDESYKVTPRNYILVAVAGLVVVVFVAFVVSVVVAFS